jgi:hypothetical protein
LREARENSVSEALFLKWQVRKLARNFAGKSALLSHCGATSLEEIHR